MKYKSTNFSGNANNACMMKVKKYKSFGFICKITLNFEKSH